MSRDADEGSTRRAPWMTASPKSRITTRPSGVTSTLEGLRSRCSLPAACSAATASASWRSAGRSRSTSQATPCSGGGAAPSVAPVGRRSVSTVTTASAGSDTGVAVTVAIRVESPGSTLPRTTCTCSRKVTPETTSMVKNQRSSSQNSSCNPTRLGWVTSASARNSFLRPAMPRASTRVSVFSATSTWRS